MITRAEISTPSPLLLFLLPVLVPPQVKACDIGCPAFVDESRLPALGQAMTSYSR